jgi:hypothetical protein
MANFRYSHLFTTKIGNAAIQAAAAKLNAAEIALAIADGEEKILFKNENGDVVSVATEEQILTLLSSVTQSITNEVARATSAETALGNLIEGVDDKVDQEIADRAADVDAEEARATSAETALQTAIEAEVTRATGAEEALDDKIEAEATRATSAETALQTAIEAEVTRATGAEEALSDRISAIESGSTQALEEEIARAKAAETALDDKIEAEKTRALSAETAIVDALADEVTERKAGAVASVDYDSSGKTIDFYNANNVKIDSIDATDFIKDGMIDSVTIETTSGTTYLVIVWNTDAGKETTRIDIGDIFDADNYYTKAEVDDIISATTGDIEEELEEVKEALSGETARATSAEAALQTAITNEATTRDNADVKSMAVDANAGITLTLGNGSTIVATEAEEITLSAGEF